MEILNKKKRKLGLVLGSGSAKGLSHIGVLKVLDEIGFKPDVITGTSMGALIGILYASGLKGKEIQEFAEGLDKKEMKKLFKPTLDGPGIVNGDVIDEYLEEIIPVKNIQDLSVPFGCCACNIIDGREIVFTKGDIVDAIRASTSIPGILTPHRIEGYALVDGGLVDPVPVSLCKHLGAEFIIAVNVLNVPVLKHKNYDFPERSKSRENNKTDNLSEKFNIKIRGFIEKEIESLELRAKRFGALLNMNDELSIIDVISQTYLIGESNLAQYKLSFDKPDILIEPDLTSIKHFDFNKANEAILIGEREMWKAVAEYDIKRIIKNDE